MPTNSRTDWTPDVRETDDPLAAAAASTCWESMAGTGVFDDVRARAVGAGLTDWIRANFRSVRKAPALMVSDLTGRVYVVTSYDETPSDNEITAHTKHDVTDQFAQLVRSLPITDAMVDAFGKAWEDTPEGESGARRRAGLRAALAVATVGVFQ